MAGNKTKKGKRPTREVRLSVANFWDKVRTDYYGAGGKTSMQNAISAMKIPPEWKKGLRQDLAQYLTEKGGQQRIPAPKEAKPITVDSVSNMSELELASLSRGVLFRLGSLLGCCNTERAEAFFIGLSTEKMAAAIKKASSIQDNSPHLLSFKYVSKLTEGELSKLSEKELIRIAGFLYIFTDSVSREDFVCRMKQTKVILIRSEVEKRLQLDRLDVRSDVIPAMQDYYTIVDGLPAPLQQIARRDTIVRSLVEELNRCLPAARGYTLLKFLRKVSRSTSPL